MHIQILIKRHSAHDTCKNNTAPIRNPHHNQIKQNNKTKNPKIRIKKQPNGLNSLYHKIATRSLPQFKLREKNHIIHKHNILHKNPHDINMKIVVFDSNKKI